MINILVTGGAGNIGSSLVVRLLNYEEYYVTVADNLTTGLRENLPTSHERFRFFECDVNSLDSLARVFDEVRYKYVFHYSAMVGVKRTLENPLAVLDDIKGVENILRLSKATGVERIFYASSSEVYGEPVEIPQRENSTPLNSRLPYAIVKNVGEAYCRSYNFTYGLKYTIFRFFNTYGPRQSQDFVISRFLNQAIRNEQLTVYGDGSQSRTYCFIEDNIDVTLRCLRKHTGINETINIGNSVEISALGLAKFIIRITGSKSVISHLPALIEGDMSRRMPCNYRMRHLLGRELTSLEDGLKIMLTELTSVRSIS